MTVQQDGTTFPEKVYSCFLSFFAEMQVLAKEGVFNQNKLPCVQSQKAGDGWKTPKAKQPS